MSAPAGRTPSPMFFMKRLIAYRPLWFAASGLCWVLFHSQPLLLGVLARAFFQSLDGPSPAGLTLESVVALVAAAGLAKAGVACAGGLSWMPLVFGSTGLLRRNVLAHILEHPGTLSLSTGEVISTLRDDVDAMGEMAGWAFDAVAGLIFAVGGIAILLRVNARVTLLVFLPLAAVIVLAQAARTRLERTRAESRAATAQVTGALGEAFSAVQAIQVAGAEDRVTAHLERLGEARRTAALRDRLLGLALDAAFAHTASLGSGLTLLVAASAMRAGAFSVGDFALFATYLMQVADYTGFLGYLVNTYRQSAVAFQRAAALLRGASAAGLVAHHPVHLSGPLPALPALVRQEGDRLASLQVAGLAFRYPETGRGVEDISFIIERGSLTVVAGRIGAGKTTLLRAVLGLLPAQAGEVRWNGRLLDDPLAFLVPPRIAYAPQVPVLLSGTLRENILLGLPDDGRLARAVQSAALERDLAAFPAGLATPVGPRGARLSGGQLQRVAAARMLVREPDLLVIDDLASALDVETERTLWRRILAPGATCLIASNHRSLLERADQILVLEDGRITACGRLPELLETSAEIRRLCM